MKPNFQSIIQAAADRNESSRVSEIQLHTKGYAEPSYSNPDSGLIATGNWNNDSRYDRESGKCVVTSTLPSRLLKIAERYGIEIEWSDENAACDQCGKLVRTQPDGYEWTPFFSIVDGELICKNCQHENNPEASSEISPASHEREAKPVLAVDHGA